VGVVPMPVLVLVMLSLAVGEPLHGIGRIIA